MIYVTSIYDDKDKGRKIGEVSKCDHGSTWLAWTWREMVGGIALALIVASQLFVR